MSPRSKILEKLHPGRVIGFEIESRKIVLAEFERRSGIASATMRRIRRGACAISPRVAVALEIHLGTAENPAPTADYWMMLQSSYDVEKIRIELRKKKKSK